MLSERHDLRLQNELWLHRDQANIYIKPLLRSHSPTIYSNNFFFDFIFIEYLNLLREISAKFIYKRSTDLPFATLISVIWHRSFSVNEKKKQTQNQLKRMLTEIIHMFRHEKKIININARSEFRIIIGQGN